MQQQIIRETFHLVSKRDDNVCNFLEGGRQVAPSTLILYKIYTLTHKDKLDICTACTCTTAGKLQQRNLFLVD